MYAALNEVLAPFSDVMCEEEMCKKGMGSVSLQLVRNESVLHGLIN
jgi:hypothetical protein